LAKDPAYSARKKQPKIKKPYYGIVNPPKPKVPANESEKEK
jgi:hypothetical protein